MIQRARPSDLSAIHRLELRAGPRPPWSLAQYERELAAAHSRLFVWWEDSALIGYGGYWQIAGEAQLATLAINPEIRRQGHGKELLTWLVDAARAEGCRRMTLEVRSMNQAAQNLYHRLGFRRTSERMSFYQDPEDKAVLMELTL